MLSPGQVSADIILLLPVSFPYQQKSFPFATKTRLHPKVSHKLKREKRNIDNCYTEEPTNLQQHQGVKQQQRQIQVRPQRSEDVWGLPGLSLRGSNLFQVLHVCKGACGWGQPHALRGSLVAWGSDLFPRKRKLRDE